MAAQLKAALPTAAQLPATTAPLFRPAPTSKPALQKLRFTGGSLLTASGTPLLTELASSVNVRLDTQPDGTGMVIGMVEPQGRQVASLDVPLAALGARRFLALGRTSLWWMTPAWGSTAAEVGAQTVCVCVGVGGWVGGWGGGA